ncbi:FAD dependent oxidoreductase [mine drainage metagenome]|uniref:FAD dependent oxidoreductase n=1 Tax=mine drainage metagenome TaxID=410659 RepID=A0A1J5TMZ0_9ZZZZ
MNSFSNDLFYYRKDIAATGRGGILDADICIYGGTAGGVVAAIQAASDGHSVVLLEPGHRIGGVTGSGLGFTDIGNKAAIGGLAREFFHRVGRRYGVDETWTFEPHVAIEVFETWAQQSGVDVHVRQFIAAVEITNLRLRAIRTESGLVVRAKVFIDASYEGDLMARAGVSYTVGRESNATYDETLNGAQVLDGHQFDLPVSPYVIEGDPTSGILPGIDTGSVEIGVGDGRLQAYCFRMCLTDDPRNRIPFPKPEHYDRRLYTLLDRYLRAGWRDVFRKFDRLRTGTKTDTNNHGAVSTDFIGANHLWTDADYATRERIFQAHVNYQMGLHWFMANDSAVPSDLREAYARWGLCRDEFTSTGGWPHQLYVREARRMRSDHVMTEHECRGRRRVWDSVGLAAYTMDSHNCRRVVRDGRTINEGNVEVHGFPPYGISFRSIIPSVGECENLIVPVCLSATHIAYGSIRMEPVFMVLGQSAALAAHIALDDNSAVQSISYADLRAALLLHRQVLTWSPDRPVSSGDLHAHEAESIDRL